MTGRAYRYRVVDVFTERPLKGNALAVFPDAAAIDPRLMQPIARELNLAETVFILPSGRRDCAARLRIFTPAREMRFAGHPTIGASFVLVDEGLVPRATGRFAVDEPVGAVPIRVERNGSTVIWLSTPPIERGRTYDGSACARMLGLQPNALLPAPPQWLSAGNPIIVVGVTDPAAVDRASLDVSSQLALEREPACVYVFARTGAGAYGRMFAPLLGVPEDPATGSAMGPLAAFMIDNGLLARVAGTQFTCEQGTRMGRRSVLHVRVGDAAGEPIEVGGQVMPVAAATMTL
jgi:trans-2,3-dihydro-3-hydroxyanthranilate isomerase